MRYLRNPKHASVAQWSLFVVGKMELLYFIFPLTLMIVGKENVPLYLIIGEILKKEFILFKSVSNGYVFRYLLN